MRIDLPLATDPVSTSTSRLANVIDCLIRLLLLLSPTTFKYVANN